MEPFIPHSLCFYVRGFVLSVLNNLRRQLLQYSSTRLSSGWVLFSRLSSFNTLSIIRGCNTDYRIFERQRLKSCNKQSGNEIKLRVARRGYRAPCRQSVRFPPQIPNVVLIFQPLKLYSHCGLMNSQYHRVWMLMPTY